MRFSCYLYLGPKVGTIVPSVASGHPAFRISETLPADPPIPASLPA